MEKKRHLSPFRVLLAILAIAAIGYGTFWQIKRFEAEKEVSFVKPWFASYVDITATPAYSFEQVNINQSNKNVILSFIVSAPNDPCTPSWGGFYNLNDAGMSLDLDRRIARFRQIGGHVAISFGGLLNDELSIKCTDLDKLQKAYQNVIDRYQVDTIDFDLEGANLTNTEALARRALVLQKLQNVAKSNKKSLAVWLTLPVAPYGLMPDGTNAIAEMLSKNVDLSGVNVMTMDYGDSLGVSESMSDGSESALIQTERQLGVLYTKAGINLDDTSLWSKLGATPMIGQNDTSNEIFTTDDATKFNNFALTKGLGRISMWSANRDIECGENYVNISIVSDSCSGVKEDKYAFANILSKGFEGDVTANAQMDIKIDPKIAEEPDDEAKSPYQIWSEAGTYHEGTKVVWHHNVYEAKWWTKGDLPDNPVLQSWQTPWQLVGPVLPGESPIPQPTLAPGIYGEWSGTEVYEAGARVVLNGIPYEAKWWTEGDSPEASYTNPDSSPWIALSQKEINEIQKPNQ